MNLCEYKLKLATSLFRPAGASFLEKGNAANSLVLILKSSFYL